jgi:PadR family transcriptional regulator, regulatory protein PadR
MDEYRKYLDSAVLELRRGTIVLCVLSVMERPIYGYSLLQVLTEKGLNVDQSTLYPLLRRLEKQNFLKSTWSIEESRPRKYYELSEEGKRFLADLKNEWNSSIRVLEKVIN